MAAPIEVARSRTHPFPVDRAYPFTLGVPLASVFDRWYGPLPPISGVDGPEGWGTVGQVRTIRTADGGSMREELLIADAPARFSYRLTEIGGPLKPLVGSIDGAWTFTPVGTGCRIEWSWVLHPTSDLTRTALRPIAALWGGYARRALDRLDELMVGALA